MATLAGRLLWIGAAAAAAGASATPVVAAATGGCIIRPETKVVYSKATGVGGASIIWVEDVLWWLKGADPSFTYQGLEEADVQACDLAALKNLRLYMNVRREHCEPLVGIQIGIGLSWRQLTQPREVWPMPVLCAPRTEGCR